MYQIRFVNRKLNVTTNINEDDLDIARKKLDELINDIPKVERGNIHTAEIVDLETGEIVEKKVTVIRQLRLNLEMTQAEFGRTFLIPKRTIENWENGTATPPPYVIKMLEVIIENGIRLN